MADMHYDVRCSFAKSYDVIYKIYFLARICLDIYILLFFMRNILHKVNIQFVCNMRKWSWTSIYLSWSVDKLCNLLAERFRNLSYKHDIWTWLYWYWNTTNKMNLFYKQVQAIEWDSPSLMSHCWQYRVDFMFIWHMLLRKTVDYILSYNGFCTMFIYIHTCPSNRSSKRSQLYMYIMR